MEQNWESKNKLLHLRSVDFQQRCQNNSMGKEYYFQQMLLEQLDIHMQKDEFRSLLTSFIKNNSKWIKDLKKS